MSGFKKSQKARVTLHIAYPENMVDDWEERAPDELEVPFAYCIHDKDASGHDGDRKTHVHIMQYWSQGGQTFRAAWSNIEKLAKPGRVCSLEPRACVNIEHAYAYLIHDTESARKAGKHLYDVSERICCNTFDIERYITLDTDAKNAMAKELCDYVISRHLKDSASIYMGIRRDFDEKYFEIYKANNAMLDRLARGNFLKWERKKQQLGGCTCIVCGSREVIGSFTATWAGDEKVWFCANHQETAYKILEEYEENEE